MRLVLTYQTLAIPYCPKNKSRHAMLRGAGAIVLLLALPGSASAIDQSGMEDTNCLMACDANGEHCRGNAPLSVRRIDPRVDATPVQGIHSPHMAKLAQK